MSTLDFDLQTGLRDTESPSTVWISALRSQLQQGRHVLSPALRGVVQIVVERAAGDAAAYVLDVAGPETAIVDGVADAPACFVETTEAELHALLYADDPPPQVLRARGDTHLFTRTLDALAHAPTPESPLAVRLRR